MWMDTYPRETDAPARDLQKGGVQSILTGGNQMFRITVDRHGSAGNVPTNVRSFDDYPGAINMAFVDGHAERVDLRDLYNFTWHRQWKRPASVSAPQ